MDAHWVDGWLHATGIEHIPSPNQDERPAATSVDLLVIHNISLPPGEFGGPFVAALFKGVLDQRAHPYFERIASIKVSAHFLIDRLGAITQFVSAEKRAWHAGTSRLIDGVTVRERCNDFSIGVELEGTDDLPYTDAQYRMLSRLTTALRRRYPIAHVRGHDQIAPGRKTDPGACFDWQRLLTEAALPAGVRPE